MRNCAVFDSGSGTGRITTHNATHIITGRSRNGNIRYGTVTDRSSSRTGSQSNYSAKSGGGRRTCNGEPGNIAILYCGIVSNATCNSSGPLIIAVLAESYSKRNIVHINIINCAVQGVVGNGSSTVLGRTVHIVGKGYRIEDQILYGTTVHVAKETCARGCTGEVAQRMVVPVKIELIAVP